MKGCTRCFIYERISWQPDRWKLLNKSYGLFFDTHTAWTGWKSSILWPLHISESQCITWKAKEPLCYGWKMLLNSQVWNVYPWCKSYIFFSLLQLQGCINTWTPFWPKPEVCTYFKRASTHSQSESSESSQHLSPSDPNLNMNCTENWRRQRIHGLPLWYILNTNVRSRIAISDYLTKTNDIDRFWRLCFRNSIQRQQERQGAPGAKWNRRDRPISWSIHGPCSYFHVFFNINRNIRPLQVVSVNLLVTHICEL